MLRVFVWSNRMCKFGIFTIRSMVEALHDKMFLCILCIFDVTFLTSIVFAYLT